MGERLIDALVSVMRVSVGPQPMVDVLRRLHARGVDVTSSEVGAAVEQDHAQRAVRQLPARFKTVNRLSLRGKTVHLTWLGETVEAPARSRAAARSATQVDSRPPGSAPARQVRGRQDVTASVNPRPRAGSAALVKRLLKLSPTAFEGVVERLLVALGVQDVTRTPPTNDAGVDVRGVLVIEELLRVRVAVQVKRYVGNVSRPEIQKLRGSLSHGEVGWFFTTGGYSEGARVEARATDRQPISLISGLEVAELLIKYGVALDEAGPAAQAEET
ncbi:restriction endonuclease [Deinococcus aerophilus]|uniref:Restriction endonuclease type IV Mrr domain-containing protein n=1 Tax=Deinococcus aerophilus TaxID=522488 RepID=A0ABQ2GYQ6_9DEIO|nr:restriction endonuclease [Deinococcus aerophilus]GGM18416.1 hypothetical protein GCM10010841_28150 [Deinococcus aerophilus]